MHNRTYQAWLWDGTLQLEGSLTFSSEELIFQPKNFQEGNLKLKILLREIISFEAFLLYGISKNGMKIYTGNGKQDSFILEDFDDFRNDLFKIIKNQK